VIGVPHPDFGESVIGLLVAEPGATLSTDAIMATLGDQLARFKQPKKLIVMEEFPRNTMGKLQKNILRAQFEDIFNPAKA
jgi:malonyl-CoA/methylmalonyl-CoA synthetase